MTDKIATTGPGPWATHAALLVVQLAFASNAVEGKLAMMPRHSGGAGLAPEAIAMARMGFAALFFQGLALLLRRRRGASAPPAPPLSGRDHLALAGLSVLGISLNQTLFLFGLRATTPLSAALLCVAIPVFAAALAVVLRHEKPTWRVAAGIGLALLGVVELTGLASVDRGAVLVVANSLAYAGYIVLGRSTIRRLGAIEVIRWIFTWGAFTFAPLGVGPLVRTFGDVDAFGVTLLVYIVVVPTIVAYAANAWALGRSSATLVTIYIYLQPLVAGALAFVQLGQRPQGHVLLAGTLILAGVTVVATRSAVAR